MMNGFNDKQILLENRAVSPWSRFLYDKERVDVWLFGGYKVWVEDAHGSKQMVQDKHIDDAILDLDQG